MIVKNTPVFVVKTLHCYYTVRAVYRSNAVFIFISTIL